MPEPTLPDPPDFGSVEIDPNAQGPASTPKPQLVTPGVFGIKDLARNVGNIGSLAVPPQAPNTLGINVIDVRPGSVTVQGPDGKTKQIARSEENDRMLGITQPEATVLPTKPPEVPPALAPPTSVPKAPGTPGSSLVGELGKSEKETLAGIETERQAQNELAGAQEHAFNITKSALAGKAEAIRLEAQRQQAHSAWVDSEVSRHVGEINKANEAVANGHVDPDHYWKVHGTGARVVSIFASALGAFGASLAKTPNYVQEQIDNAINRDISAQESEIQKTKDIASLKNNMLAQFIQRDNTLEQAKLAVHAMSLQSAETKAQSLLETAKGDQAQAGILQAVGQLQQRRGQVMEQYALKKAQVLSSMAPRHMKLEDELKLRALRVHLPGEKDPRMADNPEAAGKVREGVQNYLDVSNTLKEMRDLVNNKWQSLPLSEARKKVEVLNNKLVAQTGQAYKLGVLSESDKKLAEQLGDPTAWSQRDSVTNGLLDQAETNLKIGMNNLYKAHGLTE